MEVDDEFVRYPLLRSFVRGLDRFLSLDRWFAQITCSSQCDTSLQALGAQHLSKVSPFASGHRCHPHLSILSISGKGLRQAKQNPRILVTTLPRRYDLDGGAAVYEMRV